MDPVQKVTCTVAEYKTIGELKSGVISGTYGDKNDYFSRCFLWKSILLLNSLDSKEWSSSLEAARTTFEFLSKQYYPPFSYLETESEYYETDDKSSNETGVISNSAKKQSLINPKRLSNGTSWGAKEDPLINNSSIVSLQKDVEELNTIVLDIERIFPGMVLFQDIKIKKQLVIILFVWYKLNQDIGYRQGMHEILSLIYLVVHNESTHCANHKPKDYKSLAEKELILEIFNKNEIMADVFHMFTLFMINPQASFYNEANLLKRCEDFNSLLKDFDYDLYYYLTVKLRLESQIWLIRWFRLLFIREFNIGTVTVLWDKLLSFEKIKNLSTLTENNDFDLILECLVLIFLIKIKKNLIIDCNDYGDVLKLLLNYPIAKISNSKVISKKIDSSFDFNAILSNINCENLTHLFNEAVLIFNSRKSLRFIGKFLNEKYNKDFINSYEKYIGTSNFENSNYSFVANDSILDKLRFQNRLEKRVKNALKG